MNFSQLSATSIQKKIVAKECTAIEVCEAALQRIGLFDPGLKAFLHLDAKGARKAATAVDQKIAANQPVGPLAGVPIALKDNLCTQGMPTTCASRILEKWQPPYNATVVERLLAADAVVLGKVNMDEFAMGSSCENSGFFSTRNPWNTHCVTGGSSGGSAAVVAADMAPLALGSDTGGSIRQPASFCGVIGFKPTYGRVSRYGLVAYASSLDQIGPFGKTVDDVALLLSVIAGHDPKDSTSAAAAVPDYLADLSQDIAGMTIGLPREYFAEGLQPEVAQAIEAAKKTITQAGAAFVEVSLPHTEYCLATYYLVATAEASSNLARYDGVQYGMRAQTDNLLAMYKETRAAGFGEEVKRRIMLGTYALSAGYYDAYYKKALQVRTLIQNDFQEVFKTCDMIMTPTSPTVAFKTGEKSEDPLSMYLSDIYTISINLAGLPAISIPCGMNTEGLPIGMQLVGKVFGESALLRTAQAFQSQTDWHTRRPDLSGITLR
ncbi:Asp-tRNA(Asn)/Glu-tRNA(Gln) amidotransferase subunit GatA [bacterium]|nr:Asp-tRNA(Asn)/Glu-tRNA(Gln) amidotransferase subunit GatA [bacterium]